MRKAHPSMTAAKCGAQLRCIGSGIGLGPPGGSVGGVRGGSGSGGGWVAMPHGSPVAAPPGPTRVGLWCNMDRMKQHEQAAGAQPEFAHDAEARQYELRLEGQVIGLARYRIQDNAVRFTHTEVNTEHQGKGLASRLAAYALDDVKSRGMKAVPVCPFIARYIEKHEKEYGALLQ